jgi:hypothetical protein
MYDKLSWWFHVVPSDTRKPVGPGSTPRALLLGMESWEGLLRKKGYDGSRYQVKSLEVLAGKQGVGWRTKKWHPDGNGPSHKL